LVAIDVFDLLVGEFLGRAEQAVTGVADDHVDASELRERAFNDLANRRGVGHVEHLGVERLGIMLDQIGDLAGVANGSDRRGRRDSGVDRSAGDRSRC
jgi:hypothetical protein